MVARKTWGRCPTAWRKNTAEYTFLEAAWLYFFAVVVQKVRVISRSPFMIARTGNLRRVIVFLQAANCNLAVAMCGVPSHQRERTGDPSGLPTVLGGGVQQGLHSDKHISSWQNVPEHSLLCRFHCLFPLPSRARTEEVDSALLRPPPVKTCGGCNSDRSLSAHVGDQHGS